jgi:hypothetical protein
MRLDHLPSSTLPGRERVLPACHSQTPFPVAQALFSLEGVANTHTSPHGVSLLAVTERPGSEDATELDVIQNYGLDASVAPTAWLVSAHAAEGPARSTGRRRTPGI